MNLRSRSRGLPWLIGALAVAFAVVPALAVDPSPGGSASPATSPAASVAPERSPSASGGAKPDKSPKPAKADKADKAEKKDRVPKVATTLTGTVAAATDADGDAGYTLSAGGKTYRLEAGPSWWWGDAHPLKAFVGKSVTIVGEAAVGSDTVDVRSVAGKEIRANGRPPWAGGWKVVGPKHPGWSADKAARHAAKGEHGRANAPGQLKDKSRDGAEASDSPG